MQVATYTWGSSGSSRPPSRSRKSPQSPLPLTWSALQVERHDIAPSPDEVMMKKNVARHRTAELQQIFASRHAPESEALQKRLAELDAEEVSLRSTLATMQQALEEAQAERRARDLSSTTPVEAAPESTAEGGSEEGLEGVTHDATPESLSQTGGESSEAAPTANKHVQWQNYSKELTSPILTRRRAEAKFREACLAHENSMAQMKAEYAELERRLRKQQLWMTEVEKQVLQAELTKVRYSIRLDKAERRVKSLSQDLSKAYEVAVTLLEDRMRVEDTRARNEALVLYIHSLGRAESRNGMEFTDNKQELNRLLERCRECSYCQEKLDALVHEIRSRKQLVGDLLRRCDQLLGFSADFQTQWTRVPAALKETVFRSEVKKSADQFAHPVAAMHAIQDSMTIVMKCLSTYSVKLENVAGPETDEAVVVSTLSLPKC